jgi:hypothetical protein
MKNRSVALALSALSLCAAVPAMAETLYVRAGHLVDPKRAWSKGRGC